MDFIPGTACSGYFSACWLQSPWLDAALASIQVHYTWPNGRGSLLMGIEPTRPPYSRLVEMLKAVPNTRASRSWVDRVLDINNLKGTYMLCSVAHCTVTHIVQ